MEFRINTFTDSLVRAVNAVASGVRAAGVPVNQLHITEF